jgi:transcriptional regulator with XRE-family HTH domain
MKQSKIRKLRIDEGFRLNTVAALLGRTKSWLSKVETGKIRVCQQTAGRIAEVIARLSRLRSESESARGLLPELGDVFRDLRLPQGSKRGF